MLGTGYVVVATLLVASGAALALVGVAGLRRRLPRNRFAGVRTVNTMRDEETFAVGNQVGAPLTIASGAIAVFGGLAVFAAPSRPAALTVIVVAVLGAVALTVAGGVLGDRAAARVPLPEPLGCSGVCAGCSLVDGCSPAPDGSDSDETRDPAAR